LESVLRNLTGKNSRSRHSQPGKLKPNAVRTEEIPSWSPESFCKTLPGAAARGSGGDALGRRTARQKCEAD
jgi:hypothetical protein